MAYDDRHKRIMARALALCGGNVAAACRYLKEHTVECPDVSESTLRRLRDLPEFEILVTEQRAIIDSESSEAARVAERSRLKREMEGTVAEHVADMERKGWALFERLCTMMESSEADPKALLSFWRTAQSFVIELKKQSGEGIHELWQAQYLIRAFREVIQTHIGPNLAEAAMREAWKRYQDYVQAHAEANASDGAGANSGEVNDGQAQTAAAITASGA